ncbi:MAG: imelysin, partial [Prevotella sp.]|nr:imelysin [Prevotella sp.]
DKACADFKQARQNWERSEAFLMGAASDFDIDPTIDSWPLNRSLLLNYFNNGMNDEMLEDATILGFHALEFILFRNGQNRKVAELQGNDTYTNFEKITGAQELAYAQTICTLLKQRCFQLQVAWEGETAANAARVAVVKAAGLDMTTAAGLSYGENLKQAGVSGSKSTFPTLKDAIAQVLINDEGSCLAICNEVGTAKIANPFSAGDIAYVESPYSYNSITDFRDNIRSIRNVWLGSTDKKANEYSFHTFFASVKSDKVNTAVESNYVGAIEGISNMPTPFVKYCSVVWGKNFDDPDNWDSTSGE